YRVRVRLFRSIARDRGEPGSDSSIDLFAALPTLEDTGVVEATAFLPTDRVAHPIGTLDAPVALLAGPPSELHVGTWAAARHVSCSGSYDPAREGCVEGGAFWMGDPAIPFADQG